MTRLILVELQADTPIGAGLVHRPGSISLTGGQMKALGYWFWDKAYDYKWELVCFAAGFGLGVWYF